MGYSASLVDGDAIIINDGTAFWAGLVTAATSSDWPGANRFSWTEEVDEYIKRYPTDAERASSMMRDYGFDGVSFEGDVVTLEWWGGDKIGMSWDDIWDVIAQHAEPYRWVMHGEDGLIWCEDNPDGQRRQRDLNLDLAFPS